VLAAGKGWVLPVLAMLAAQVRLRVAARGSGPGAKRAALALRCAPQPPGGVGTRNVPSHRHRLRRVEQGTGQDALHPARPSGHSIASRSDSGRTDAVASASIGPC